MIAKITSGNSFYGVAKYNDKKIKSGQAYILDSKRLYDVSPKGIDKTMNSISNDRIKKPVFHASLNFAKADAPKLTDAKMTQIAQQYLKEMGYEKQPYILYRHQDTDHPHLHIITTRVDVESRKKIPDSFEGRKSKAITIELEKQYGLIVATTQDQTKKEITQKVQLALRKGKPENLSFLNKQLAEMGTNIRARQRGKDIVYYKVGENNRSIIKPLQAATFKAEGLDQASIRKVFKQNKIDRLYVKTVVENTIKDKTNLSPKRFAEALQQQGVQAQFRQGNKGILNVQYRYKDHAYNGGTLDRNLSWNKVKKHLDFKGDNAHNLRKNILEASRQKQAVKIEYKNGQIHLKSDHTALQQSLKDLPKAKALSIAKYHNERLEKVDKGLIRALEGNELDAYLQRLFKRKQAEKERQLKQN